MVKASGGLVVHVSRGRLDIDQIHALVGDMPVPDWQFVVARIDPSRRGFPVGEPPITDAALGSLEIGSE